MMISLSNGLLSLNGGAWTPPLSDAVLRKPCLSMGGPYPPLSDGSLKAWAGSGLVLGQAFFVFLSILPSVPDGLGQPGGRRPTLRGWGRSPPQMQEGLGGRNPPHPLVFLASQICWGRTFLEERGIVLNIISDTLPVVALIVGSMFCMV